MKNRHPLLGCRCDFGSPDFGCNCYNEFQYPTPVPTPMGFSLSSLFSSGSSSSSGTTYNPTPQNTADGMTAMQYFFNEAITYQGLNYPLDWTDFVAYVNQATNNSFFTSLGMAIDSASVPTSVVQNVMIKMADTGQGQLPTNSNGTINWGAFASSVGQAGADPSFWSALTFTVAATASQIVSGVATAAEDVGQGVLATGSMLETITQYLPYVLVGAGVLYVFFLAGGPEKVFADLFKKSKSSGETSGT